MPTVTINGNVYNALADDVAAAIYFGGRAGGIAWTGYANGAETLNDQKRALVSATNLLDLQPWQGSKTSPSQPNEQPRSGLVDRDGNAISSSVTAPDILSGYYELALQLLLDPTLQDSTQGSSSNVKSIIAKGAGVTFFAPVIGSRLPSACFERIAPYLQSSGATGSKAFGISDWSSDTTTCCSGCGLVECTCPQIWRDQFALDREPV